ncbi:MAG: IS5 family transposase, partial [Aeromonas veronii]
HCMQQWYNLSDGAMEDALYEIASMRLFAKLSLDQAIPDRTTIMNFRHLLEQHQLARQLFDAINQWLCDAGIMMKQGTLVDAKSGLTHSLETTAANEHDLNQAGHRLHGEEALVFADAGYQGAENREALADVKAQWAIAMRPGKLKELKKHPRKNKAVMAFEKLKSSIRAKVEHPFRLIKRQFGFVKARYKGLRKNDNQLTMLFTLANLFRVDQMIRAWDSGAQKSK